MKRHNPLPLFAWLAASACVFATQASQASAGEVLFVLGKTDVNRAGGEIPAERGTVLEVADQVIVGPASHAQIRMKDGALVALQPGSTLLVQDFNLPAPAAAEPPAGARRSVLLLVKGGLRTITGLIGKHKEDKYAVSTPIAVIGVRGTDYRIAFCHGDCPGTPDGLYVGDSSGGIHIANAAGALDLSDGEFAYVASADSPPEKVLKEPEILEIVLNPKDQTTVVDSVDDCNCVSDKPGGYRAPNVPGKIDGAQSGQLFAYSTAAEAVGADTTHSSQQGPPQLSTNGSGALIAFGSDSQVPTTFALGNAVITNPGFDPETGLRWGRWEGIAQIGGQDADLSNAILHWIVSSPLIGTPAIPLTGSADYSLIGNTDPTDNHGNVGALGSAHLGVDFTNQTVTSSLALLINDQNWSASGAGSIAHGQGGAPLPLFNGTYATTVNGQGGGNGNFSGFFTPPRGGSPLPGGAGLTYNLTSGGTTVSGAAAFGKPKPTVAAP